MASGNNQLVNLQAQQLAAQIANWAAQLEFQKERFRLLELPEWQSRSQLDVDKFAWEKANQTWENAFKEATITGKYQGMDTIDWLTRQAQLTGVLNGTETLQGKLTSAQIAQMNAQMKLANDEFLANTTGYLNGVKTFDREKWEASQGMAAWQFISTLSGPQNAFKQARAIATMPGGFGQMMDAWAGKFAPAGMGAVGSGGQASLADMRLGWGGTYEPGGAPGATGGQPPQSDEMLPLVAGVAPGTVGQHWTKYVAPFPGPWNQVPNAAAGQAPGVAPAAAPTPPPAPDPVPLVPTPDTLPGTAPPGIAAATPGVEMPVAPPTASPGYTYSPPGVQAPVNAYNYTPTPAGSMQVSPPGIASPHNTPDISTQTPVSPLTAQQMYGGQYVYGGIQEGEPHPGTPGGYYPTDPNKERPAQTLPTIDPNQVPEVGTGLTAGAMLLPNQINAKNYKNSFQYQKDLGWAAYEDAGTDKGLAMEAFQRSLPKYGGPARGKVSAF